MAAPRSRSVAGLKPSIGERSAVGLATGCTTYGVTMITSSSSPRWKSLDLNSAPITGTSPIHGRAFVWSILVFCSNPAMAKLWPLPSSIVVSARRTVSAGIVSVPPETGTLTAPFVLN